MFEDFNFCSQLCVFLFYENPMVSLMNGIVEKLKCCKGKCCSVSSFKKKILYVKDVSKILTDKLDLKEILAKIYNNEINISHLY